MKKLLSLLLVATSAVSIGQVLEQHNTKTNTNIMLKKGDFKTIVSKTYPDKGQTIDGLEAISKVKNNFYGVVIEGNVIKFYSVVNNKMILLNQVSRTQLLQIGSGTATVINDCIYYEFLIKTDQYNVGSGQYFKLDLKTNSVKVIGDYQIVPTTNRYMYDNSEVKTHIYGNYLIITHSYTWYANSSTTIINLNNDSVVIKSSNTNIYMVFSHGYLFFDNLYAYNVTTGKTVNYDDTLNVKSMFTINYKTYVVTTNFNNTYTINEATILSIGKIALVPIVENTNINPISGYEHNNKTYFYELKFDPNKYIETAYIYVLNGKKIALVKTYAFPRQLDSSNAYNNFNDKYLYLNRDNLAIRINLDTLEVDFLNTNESILNIIYDNNTTYTGIWDYKNNSYYIALGAINWK